MTVKRPEQHDHEGLAWVKSSHSAGDGGDCVDVAACLSGVHVRDSKDTNRPGLVVGGPAWTAFVGFARR
ncbi:DUF397 domain-containing protein [Streptomyces genisteinicus]|uniref:DUF397 domain-containing protein n=1 Tax=Streptomyces genisteinicus TaxID=2768068 RepID=A0A7H0HZI8_9ACTN|nr:DUF397 domain-containing protein [Streptomyces genisteinicus]QNP65954.1 DUF397 domain-containing protein [Streptomyces genisteinicus]